MILSFESFTERVGICKVSTIGASGAAKGISNCSDAISYPASAHSSFFANLKLKFNQYFAPAFRAGVPKPIAIALLVRGGMSRSEAVSVPLFICLLSSMSCQVPLNEFTFVKR